MMTKAEICEADSKLQRDYKKGIITLDEWNFSKLFLKDEFTRVTKEEEVLEKLMKKYSH